MNTSAWIVGALAFNSLIFLPIRDCLVVHDVSDKLKNRLLLCCWLATLWQAVDAVGMRILLLDRIIAQIFLRAHGPAFIGGILLGSLYIHRKIPSNTQTTFERLLISKSGSLIAVLVLLCSFLIPISTDEVSYSSSAKITGSEYAVAWVSSGAALPLWGWIIWGLSRGPKRDALAGLLSSRPATSFSNWISPLRYTALLLQHPSWLISQQIVKRLNGPNSDTSTSYVWVAFSFFFPFFTVICHFTVCIPLSRVLQYRWIKSFDICSDSDAARSNEKISDSAERFQTASMIVQATNFRSGRLFLYYTSMIAVVLLFVICQQGAGTWVTIADMTSIPVAAQVFQYFSWFLLLPAPALIQGLLGLILFPAVAQPEVSPLEEQLNNIRKIAQDEQIEFNPQEFKIFFRIVTRGNISFEDDLARF